MVLTVAFCAVFTVKGGYPDVLCIHYQEGVAHVEKEHPELPGGEGEIHLKLIPDASLKVCKLAPDEFVNSDRGFVKIAVKHFVKINLPPRAAPPERASDPIKTVRLII